MAQTLYSQQSRAAADRQHRQSGGDTVGAAAVSAGCVAYIFHLPVQGHQDLRQGIPDTHTHTNKHADIRISSSSSSSSKIYMLHKLLTD